MTTNDRSDPNDSAAGERWMSVAEIQNSYAEYADWFDRLGWLNRLLSGRYRRQQFATADGRVLDVACGTGTNFRYLPETAEVLGVDISPEMLDKAAEELDRLPIQGSLKRMDAQDLAFADDSFDTVISSLSTCTFPDPIAALQEMERVCRPDGEIRLVEHGKSDVELLARYQEWRADAHYTKMGCRATQEPLALVERAGLSIESTGSGQFGRITTIRASPSDGA